MILQTSEMDSSTSSSKSNRRKRKFDASQPKPHRQGALKEQANGSSVKRPRGRPRKNQNGKLSGETKRERPRFELEMSDAADQGNSFLFLFHNRIKAKKLLWGSAYCVKPNILGNLSQIFWVVRLKISIIFHIYELHEIVYLL